MSATAKTVSSGKFREIINMFKRTFSLKALALFAGACLVALSSYGVFSSSLQGRVMWSGKPMSSGAAVRDVKADCGDDAGKKLSPEERKARREEKRAQMKAYDPERREKNRQYFDQKTGEHKQRLIEAKEERERPKREEREAQRKAEREKFDAERTARAEAETKRREQIYVQHNAKMRELDKQAGSFRRQLKRGDCALSVRENPGFDDWFTDKWVVAGVSPPLAEVLWESSYSPSGDVKTIRIDNLYPCTDSPQTKK